MADYLPLLLKDPSGTLKPIKPTNPILKEVFQAIPEDQRRGVAMPDRGHALKAWLEQWALDRQRGESRQSSSKHPQQQQQLEAFESTINAAG